MPKNILKIMRLFNGDNDVPNTIQDKKAKTSEKLI